MPGRLPLVVRSGVLLGAGLIAVDQHASASPGDIYMTQLSCDSSPEFVRVKNFGGASQSLSDSYIQSDPSQNYLPSNFVGSISAGQTLEFQSGTGAASNPGAGIYRLTGSFIYRNGDSTDYARLARSDSTSQQVNCGSVPPPLVPRHSPLPTLSGIA